MNRYAIAILTLPALLVTVLAQSGSGQPLIRVRSEAVFLHVTVLDEDGSLVRGLSPADFRLQDDGRARGIQTFAEVTAAAGAGAAVPNGEAVSPPVPPEKRFLVLHFSSDLDPFLNSFGLYRAKRAARDLVGRLDPENDFTAVSWTNRVSEFTSDPDRLLRLIDEAKPRRYGALATTDPVMSGPAGEDPQFQVPTVLRDLQSGYDPSTQPGFQQRLEELTDLVRDGSLEGYSRTLARLSALQGRKVLVFFGRGHDIPRLETSIRLDLYDPDRIARRFNDAGFSVYAVNANGKEATPFSGLPSPQESASIATPTGRESLTRASFASSEWLRNNDLQMWSEKTGGFGYVTSDLEKWAMRAAERAQNYYLLSFTVPDAELDGKYHEIEVQLPNPRWKALHRGGYFATIPSPEQLEQRTVMTGLTFPDQFDDFPLAIAARPPAGGELRVTLSFPFENIPLVADARATTVRQQIRMYLVATDARGSVVGALDDVFHVEIGEGQLREFRVGNAKIERTVPLAKGTPAVLKAVLIVGDNEQVAALSQSLQ